MLEELRFDGAPVVVTGAGSGIGQATAEVLGELGATVILADISRENLDRSEALMRDAGYAFEAHLLDVTDEDAIRALQADLEQRWDHLKGLVNNAGTSHFTPLTELPSDTWRQMIELDLTSVYLMCKAFVAMLARAPAGAAIVNIASVFALSGFPATPVYSAAKGGVVSLSRQLAADLGKDGIRVNAICPGATLSPLVKGEIEAGIADRALLESLMMIGRLGECRDIGNAIAFMASDAASFMTAANMVVDGGQSAG